MGEVYDPEKWYLKLSDRLKAEGLNTWERDRATAIDIDEFGDGISAGLYRTNEKIKAACRSLSVQGKMPEGLSGIALGPSEQFNAMWQHNGWVTLDIDPQAGATYTVDLAQVETLPQYPDIKGSFDFVVSRYMCFDILDTQGIFPEFFIEKSFDLLKEGGVIAIENRIFYKYDGERLEQDPTSSIPMIKDMANLMLSHGFQDVLVVISPFRFDSYDDINDPEKGVFIAHGVTFYGVKGSRNEHVPVQSDQKK
jgi:hypothetical protein